MSNATVVGHMYDAFLRGDIPFLLDHMSQSVDWETIGDGEEVVVRVTTEWRVVATGKTFIDEELHWWVFDPAGKVIRFRHYIDTAKHMAANAPG